MANGNQYDDGWYAGIAHAEEKARKKHAAYREFIRELIEILDQHGEAYRGYCEGKLRAIEEGKEKE